MQEDFYISLLYKKLDQSISAEEEKELNAWISESPENQELAEQIRLVWQESGHIGARPEVNLDEAFAELEDKMPRIEEVPKTAKLRRFNNSWMRIAAAITFLIAAALLLSDFWQNPEVKWQLVESGEERRNITLPDQSQIQLKEHSKISYPENFAGDIRQIRLEGEAFFEVERNPNKAFEISLDKAKVRVLGTSFLVRAYPSEDENLLQVESGKVSFSSTESQESIILNKGEQAILKKSTNALEKRTDISLNERAWATQKLSFEGEALEKVLEVISDVYGVSFNWETSGAKSCPFVSNFDKDNLEDILATINEVLEVQFIEASGNIYSVKGGSCD